MSKLSKIIVTTLAVGLALNIAAATNDTIPSSTQSLRNVIHYSRRISDDTIEQLGLRPEFFDVFLMESHIEEKEAKSGRMVKRSIDSLRTLQVSVKKGIKSVEASLWLRHFPPPEYKCKGAISLQGVDFINNISLDSCDMTTFRATKFRTNSLSIRQSHVENLDIEGMTVSRSFDIEGISGHYFEIEDSHFEGTTFIKDVNYSIYSSRIRACLFEGDRTNIILGDSTKVGLNLYKNRFNSEETFFVGNSLMSYPFAKYRENRADVSNLVFGGKVYFDAPYHPSTSELIKFSDIEFKDKVEFKNNLPDTIVFDDVSIEKEVDFTWVYVEDKCVADFYNSDVEKIKMDFRDFKFHKMSNSSLARKFWRDNKMEPERVKREMDKMEAVYLKLLERQKVDGSFESYVELDLAYKRFKFFSMERSSFLDGTYYLLAKGWWNFGYAKYRILLWTTLLFVLFGFFNYRHFDFLLNDVYTIAKIKEEAQYLEANTMSKKALLVKKSELVFYYTAVIFFGLKLDGDNFHYREFKGSLYIYLMYSVGILCLAFILNYIISI